MQYIGVESNNQGDVKMSKYEVKGVKNHRGHEGEPLAECGLYRDGVKVAVYSAGDWGGEAQIWWVDAKAPKVEVKGIRFGGEAFSYQGTPEEALLTAHCATIPPEPFEYGDHKPTYTTPDIFIEGLVNDYESNKRVEKYAKTKTIFLAKKNGQTLEHTKPCPYTPEVKAQIEAEFGVNLVKILNTEFVGAADVEALKKKELEARIKRACKTKTVLRMADGRTLVYPVPYSPVVKAKLESQHGNNLVEIVNETMACPW